MPSNFTSKKIYQLLDSIEDQDYALPVFQRNFVWKPAQIQSYIEALYNTDPTGQIILWETEFEKGEKKVLIIDGQQRLTSLVTAFTGVQPKFYEGEDFEFKLYFNPFEETFSRRKTEGKYWVLIAEYFQSSDKAKYNAEIQELEGEMFEDKNKALNSMYNLALIRDYQYAVTELDKSLSISRTVEIFKNINSEGTNLDVGDLAFATVSVKWEGFKKDFNNFTKKIESEMNFKENPYFYMRLLAVISGKSALLDDIHDITTAELKKSWKLLKTILPEILKALRTELNIFTKSDIVTKNIIYIISTYLTKQKNNSFKNSKDRKMWMYWVLLASVHRRYSGSGGDNKINIDARIARGENPLNQLLRNVDEQANGRELHPNLVRGAVGKMNNPVFWVYALMLRNKGATDWLTGIEFFPPKSSLSQTHIHHIFPKEKKTELREAGQEELYLENLPNKAILKGRSNTSIKNEYPEVYLKEVKKNYPESLEDQVIPGSSYWKINRFDNFIEKRSSDLAKDLNQFIESFNVENIIEEEVDYKKLYLSKESEKVEWKASFSTPSDKEKGKPINEVRHASAKALAAFANTNGGTLVIGVDDKTGDVIGIDSDLKMLRKDGDSDIKAIDRFEDHLTSYISDNVISAKGLKFNGVKIDEMEFKDIGGKTILLIHVDKIDRSDPCHANGKVYRRVNTQDKEVKSDELVSFIKGEL